MRPQNPMLVELQLNIVLCTDMQLDFEMIYENLHIYMHYDFWVHS